MAYVETRVVQTAHVPASYRDPRMNQEELVPASLSTDIPAGAPLVLDSDGKVVEATLSSSKVDDGQTLFAIANEMFQAALSAAGSVPHRRTIINATLLMEKVWIRGNLYVDGAGGANETVAQTDLGATCIMKKIGSGLTARYVFDKETSSSSLMTFTIVKLVDPVGTVNGRVCCKPTSTFRYAGF